MGLLTRIGIFKERKFRNEEGVIYANQGDPLALQHSGLILGFNPLTGRYKVYLGNGMKVRTSGENLFRSLGELYSD